MQFVYYFGLLVDLLDVFGAMVGWDFDADVPGQHHFGHVFQFEQTLVNAFQQLLQHHADDNRLDEHEDNNNHHDSIQPAL